MKNDFEIRGDVTVIFLNYKNKKVETRIDTKDLPKVNEVPGTWTVYWDPKVNGFYCRSQYKLPNQKTISLHRWVLDAPKNKQVDHFDNDPLNNTRKNLRIVTLGQNLQNKSGAYRNSKSGVRGVCWHKKRRKWIAHFRVNGERKYLGLFSDIEEATAVVKEARAEHMPYSKEAMEGKLN